MGLKSQLHSTWSKNMHSEILICELSFYLRLITASVFCFLATQFSVFWYLGPSVSTDLSLSLDFFSSGFHKINKLP